MPIYYMLIYFYFSLANSIVNIYIYILLKELFIHDLRLTWDKKKKVTYTPTITKISHNK